MGTSHCLGKSQNTAFKWDRYFPRPHFPIPNQTYWHAVNAMCITMACFGHHRVLSLRKQVDSHHKMLVISNAHTSRVWHTGGPLPTSRGRPPETTCIYFFCVCATIKWKMTVSQFNPYPYYISCISLPVVGLLLSILEIHLDSTKIHLFCSTGDKVRILYSKAKSKQFSFFPQ